MTSSAQPILSTHHLSRTVVSNEGNKQIVADISCQFYAGRMYSIIGPSGAGKSSLLRLLNRLDEPTDGTVQVENKDYREFSPCELRQKVGYLFQQPYMFDGSVLDNLRFARSELSREEGLKLLTHVGLNESFIERSTEPLSLGEKQRVALARILALGPSILLLDEPTSSLDPAATQRIEKLVCSLVNNDGLTVIMVTHYPEQAKRLGGETLLLSDGRLAESGHVEQVVDNPQSVAGLRYRDKETE